MLTFWLNGEPIEEKVFKGSGVMEVVLSKPDAIREDKYIELRVQASSYYNPKEAGVSEDARNLSWRLQRIGQQ